MTHRFDTIEVATQADVATLRGEINELRLGFDVLRGEMNDLRIESREGLAAVNQRLDRLFLTLLVGVFGMVAALVGVIITLP